jgi:hypothetical protein
MKKETLSSMGLTTKKKRHTATQWRHVALKKESIHKTHKRGACQHIQVLASKPFKLSEGLARTQTHDHAVACSWARGTLMLLGTLLSASKGTS